MIEPASRSPTGKCGHDSEVTTGSLSRETDASSQPATHFGLSAMGPKPQKPQLLRGRGGLARAIGRTLNFTQTMALNVAVRCGAAMSSSRCRSI